MTPPLVSRAADFKKRMRRLIEHEFEFVWRSLRRLGVRESDVEDAAQKVLVIASEKLDSIQPNSERAFLFQTCLRVASHARRTYRRDRMVLGDDESQMQCTDPTPGLDDLLERKRLREEVDRVLDEMPIELRAVLVLYEVEQMTTPEIASLLGIPLGTAASRLRRARETFLAILDPNANGSASEGGKP